MKSRMTRAACVMGFGLVAAGWLSGCHSQGPAERAGESIDRGAQNVKDAVVPAGPLEKAGRAVDRTVSP